MRQEVAYWLHTLAVAGERVNSWVLAEWVRVAAAVAAGQDLCSFTGLSVEEWVAAARRRYHDRHHRLPPPSYLHNHRATIARLHAALTLACQAGQPWWRCPVWDPRHDRRIPVREHEPLEGQRLNFARVSPAWLREAIQWYFAAGLSTGLLSWSSLPSFLSYLGRHFAAFLAAEGIDTPVLEVDPEAGIRPVAVRLAAWLRQQRTRSGRPLAPPTIGLIQTTVAGFYAFMADRRGEAARELGEPRWAVGGLGVAHPVGPLEVHQRPGGVGDLQRGGELGEQPVQGEELIQARQAQHRQRTGTEMGPDHVWLAERARELSSLRAIIAALESGPCGGAVRGAGVPARPGQPVPVTISRKPGGHGAR